jgi:hypothetical protein
VDLPALFQEFGASLRTDLHVFLNGPGRKAVFCGRVLSERGNGFTFRYGLLPAACPAVPGLRVKSFVNFLPAGQVLGPHGRRRPAPEEAHPKTFGPGGKAAHLR